MIKFGNSYFKQYLSSHNRIREFGRDKLRLTPIVPTLREVIRNLPEQTRVLDVGCGTGNFLHLIERENAKVVTFGIDIGTPPEFIPSATFVHGSATDIPFESERFDLVTCAHVLEHLNDPYAAVAEMVRICRPGGYIYVETPSGASTMSMLGGTFWDDPTHIRPYSPPALAWMLSGHPIDILKKGRKRSIPALLLGLPYMAIGALMGDKQASSFFPAYAFGFNAYLMGQKQNS